MKFVATSIPGVHVVEHRVLDDDRGAFMELFNTRVFGGQGLPFRVDQVNASRSMKAGTVRGMHWQSPPESQVKLVRCTAGEVWDVVVDVRPESPTYLRHEVFHLKTRDAKAVLVPKMCAHGWQALKDGSEIMYLVEGLWCRDFECGLRPGDPALGIRWPLPVAGLNRRDAEWPPVVGP